MPHDALAPPRSDVAAPGEQIARSSIDLRAPPPVRRAAGVARVIAEITAVQHGVLARWQLLAGGLSEQIIDRRVSTGQLRRLYRSVYAAGPLVSWQGSLLAAVLACGLGALLSHISASVLWRLLPEGAARDVVDVSVRSGERRRPGIRLHRPSNLLVNDAGS
jgi:hypothetical protein